MDTKSQQDGPPERSPRPSPLAVESRETLEETKEMPHPTYLPTGCDGDKRRTPGEIGREIVRDVHDLGDVLAEPHYHDCIMAEELLGVSDELRHLAEDERIGGDPLLWRGSRRRFGRRPAPKP